MTSFPSGRRNNRLSEARNEMKREDDDVVSLFTKTTTFPMHLSYSRIVSNSVLEIGKSKSQGSIILPTLVYQKFKLDRENL